MQVYIKKEKKKKKEKFMKIYISTEYKEVECTPVGFSLDFNKTGFGYQRNLWYKSYTS